MDLRDELCVSHLQFSFQVEHVRYSSRCPYKKVFSYGLSCSLIVTKWCIPTVLSSTSLSISQQRIQTQFTNEHQLCRRACMIQILFALVKMQLDKYLLCSP